MIDAVAGDDLVGGLIGNDLVGAHLTATVDSLLDQLVASPTLHDIDAVHVATDLVHDLIG